MALVTRFDTPAALRDVPAGSVFYSNWHNFVASSLNTTSGSGKAVGQFYDASEVDVTVAAERNLVRMAFPRQVLWIAGMIEERLSVLLTATYQDATRKTNAVSGA